MFHDLQKQKTEATMLFLTHLTTLEPALLNRAGTAVKIVNEPYMALTVENIGLGPRGLPALSICHYGEQNGDLMRDPEMCFELEIEGDRLKEAHPYYFRNDYAGFEQNAIDEDTKIICARMIREQRAFSETWSRNLIEQGFLRAHQATKSA
ncbi:DUF6908 domain-containing protein [Terriglobus aquaticus]|uniref:DUF6908 domain-containing protein n=1 Tax=Terriglobus aquaticus TaxID=940139 RepID=A0ABW9KPX3_9BACT